MVEDRSFGNNQFGQLGLNHTDNMNQPTAVPTFAEMEVVDAACGAEHTVAVTSTGRVYSWGWGCYGNLGVGDLGHHHVPQLVPLTAIPESDGQVVSVACGWRHSGLVTANGGLYTFGVPPTTVALVHHRHLRSTSMHYSPTGPS